jgi:hypothetical protein
MKYTLQEEMEGRGVTSQNVDLETKPIPPNTVLSLQRVSFTNETNNSAIATVGVKVGGNIKWVETFILTTATYYYALKDPIFIVGGKSVIVRFGGVTTGDVLKAFVYGFYVDR